MPTNTIYAHFPPFSPFKLVIMISQPRAAFCQGGREKVTPIFFASKISRHTQSHTAQNLFQYYSGKMRKTRENLKTLSD